MTTPSKTVSGTLSSVLYHSEDTHFTIALFRGEKEDFKALGAVWNPRPGMEYILAGNEEQSERWGAQFRFTSYSVRHPQDTDGILRYIAYTAKWVGPAVGRRMIEAYGDKTLCVLREEPERVALEISGITLKRALDIQKNILENEEMENTVVALEAIVGGLGLRRTLALEIAKEMGWDAVEQLRENPYLLTRFRGIGFLYADRVALDRLAVDPRSLHRQKAGIRHILCENERRGNTWIAVDELLSQARALLSCEPSEGLQALLASDAQVTLQDQMIANQQTAEEEKIIAQTVQRMLLPSSNREEAP